MTCKPVLLMILDGWGVAPASSGNAATSACTPNLDKYFATYHHSLLEASGEYVGLPAGQIGNSEVGHLNIGSGRIIYQNLTRISKAVRDGNFFVNTVLSGCMDRVAAKDSALHLMGLVSDGGVHSHTEHLLALVKMASAKSLSKVYIHAFLDGRDVPPSSALEYIKSLEHELGKIGCGKIATVSGRYYAMDRDKRWERTQKAYDAVVSGKCEKYASAEEGITAGYGEGITDEFMKPFGIIGVDGRINDEDGVVFFNFRPDRARQLTRALCDDTFSFFARPVQVSPQNFVSMTQYEAAFPVPAAYPPESYADTLGQVVAAAGLRQLRIAETEKYAHVTFFFNGGVENPNEGEERILVPSPKVATYDLQPEMSAREVTDALLQELEKEKFSLFVLNFANPDMVGHTGVFSAAVKAMEAVDDCVGKIVEKVLAMDGCVCITADHGNLEQMIDEVAGQPHTAHTTNKVPFLMVHKDKPEVHDGILADIAPTLLQLLGLAQPEAMTGKSLLECKN